MVVVNVVAIDVAVFDVIVVIAINVVVVAVYVVVVVVVVVIDTAAVVVVVVVVVLVVSDVLCGFPCNDPFIFPPFVVPAIGGSIVDFDFLIAAVLLLSS